MSTDGIIYPNELTRIRKQSDKLVFLQDLKKIIIDKIYRQWNDNIKFIEDEINLSIQFRIILIEPEIEHLKF